MTDIRHIIDTTKRIESILVSKYGATGRGLHEKLSSVERKVPSHIRPSIRFIATMRNKAVHEDGFEIAEPEEFLRKAEWVHAELANAQVLPEGRPSLRYVGGFLAVGIVGVVLLLVGGGSDDEPRTSSPQAAAGTTRSSAPAARRRDPALGRARARCRRGDPTGGSSRRFRSRRHSFRHRGRWRPSVPDVGREAPLLFATRR